MAGIPGLEGTTGLGLGTGAGPLFAIPIIEFGLELEGVLLADGLRDETALWPLVLPVGGIGAGGARRATGGGGGGGADSINFKLVINSLYVPRLTLARDVLVGRGPSFLTVLDDHPPT